MGHLSDQGIPTAVYYQKPIHQLAACLHLGYQEGDMPAAEHASSTVLSLPFHPYLSNESVASVVSQLAAFNDDKIPA